MKTINELKLALMAEYLPYDHAVRTVTDICRAANAGELDTEVKRRAETSRLLTAAIIVTEKGPLVRNIANEIIAVGGEMEDRDDNLLDMATDIMRWVDRDVEIIGETKNIAIRKSLNLDTKIANPFAVNVQSEPVEEDDVDEDHIEDGDGDTEDTEPVGEDDVQDDTESDTGDVDDDESDTDGVEPVAVGDTEPVGEDDVQDDGNPMSQPMNIIPGDSPDIIIPEPLMEEPTDNTIPEKLVGKIKGRMGGPKRKLTRKGRA